MAPPNTIRVSTWHELQVELYRDAWQEELERFRPTVAFRGVAHARYELVNNLARLGPVSTEFEGHILRNFRKYAQRNIVPVDAACICSPPPAKTCVTWPVSFSSRVCSCALGWKKFW
jgi:hypothetical protein